MKTFIQTVAVAFAMATSFLCGVQLATSPPTVATAGPFRPRPPRPDPAPPPSPLPPLNEDHDRIFRALLPRMREVAEERAAARINSELQAAADQMARDAADIPPVESLVVGDSPAQGVMGIMLASAIAGFVKKVIVGLVTAVVSAALIALAVKYWAFIVPAVVAAITFVAWPAGWAAGKWGKS